MIKLNGIFFLLFTCLRVNAQLVTWPSLEQTIVIDMVESPDSYYLLLDYGSKEHIFMPCLYGGTYLVSMDKTSYVIDTLMHFTDEGSFQSIYSLSYLPESNALLLLGNSKDALQTSPTDLFTIVYEIDSGTTKNDLLFDDLLYQIGSINKVALDNGYSIFNISLWNGSSLPTDGNIMLSFDSQGGVHRKKVLEYEGQGVANFTSGICLGIESDSLFYAFGDNSFLIDHNLEVREIFTNFLSLTRSDKRSALQFGEGYLVTANRFGVSFLDSDLEESAELYEGDQTLIGSLGNSLSKSGAGYAYMVDNRNTDANSLALAKIEANLEEVWRIIIPVPNLYKIIWSHGIFATEDDHAIVFGSVGTWLDEDLDAFIYIIDSDGGLVSTAEPLTEAELRISPNPADGYVDIEVSDLATGSRCRVTDLSGRLVLEQKLSSTATRLDIEDIPNGIYILQLIESGRVLASEKLVKQ